MKIAVCCNAVPTKAQAEHILNLVRRTMKKVNKPFFSHTMCVYGTHRKEAFAVLSHAGMNVDRRAPAFMLKHVVLIKGPIPASFNTDGKQVLVCPDD